MQIDLSNIKKKRNATNITDGSKDSKTETTSVGIVNSELMIRISKRTNVLSIQ